MGSCRKFGEISPNTKIEHFNEQFFAKPKKTESHGVQKAILFCSLFLCFNDQSEPPWKHCQYIDVRLGRQTTSSTFHVITLALLLICVCLHHASILSFCVSVCVLHHASRCTCMHLHYKFHTTTCDNIHAHSHTYTMFWREAGKSRCGLLSNSNCTGNPCCTLAQSASQHKSG